MNNKTDYTDELHKQLNSQKNYRRIAYVVPIDGSHFDLVASKISYIYKENPFDFLFIGPTGFYTRQIADRIAKSIKKTFNRNAFLVINQYITELLLMNNYEAEVLDRGFYTIYISKIIDELYEEIRTFQENPEKVEIFENSEETGKFAYEQVNLTEKFLLLRTLSKSKTVVQYIVEIFEKVWELEFYGENARTSQQYELVESLMKDESIFAQVIREIVSKMKNVVKQLQSKYVYDPISIYTWYITNAKDIEKSREYLVLSGFFDLTPFLENSIKELFEKSKNTIFFVWQKVEDSAFSQLDNIYKFLEENGFTFDYSLCQDNTTTVKRLMMAKNISQVNVDNTYLQYEYLIKRIKTLLLEGVNPEEIGVVVPTHQHAMYVMEEFEESGIPYRYSGKIPLTDSQIVKILLQPLITIENNYRVEDLLALIESPLVAERELTMDEVEQLFKEYNFFSISLSPSEMKDAQKRYSTYFESLDKDIDFLSEKLKVKATYLNMELDEENDDESDIYLSRIERLRKLEHFKVLMKTVFKILDDIHENRKNDVDFFEWYRKFIRNSVNKIDKVSSLFIDSSRFNRNISKSIGKELNAFSKFIDTLNSLETYIKKLKESNVVRELKSWDKIFKFFLVLLNANGYRETFKSANVVDILDLSTARFMNKTYKFFIEFTDDHYPSISKINPLLYRTTNERTKIYNYFEESEKRTIILSLIFSNEAELIFPQATNTGEEIVPSKYLYEFSRSHKNAEFLNSDIFKEIDYQIYKLKKAAEKLNQKYELRPEDFTVGSIRMYDFSHSKLSAYQSCPLYFYYSSVANVAKPQKVSEKLKLSNGLIVHRVLKKFFEQPLQFGLDEELKKALEDWIRNEYKSLFSEGMWKYSIPREMKVREISKELFPFLQDFLLSKRIINLNAKSFSTLKWVNEMLISASTIALEREFRAKLEEYSILTRVDRIDRVDESYLTNEGEKTGRPTYAIIDYKYSSSSIEHSQIEQLLLYDFAISNSNNDIIPKNLSFDAFLIFLSVKRDYKERINYTYIKSVKIRDADENDDENDDKDDKNFYTFNIKRKKSSSESKSKSKKQNVDSVLQISSKEFKEWLKELLVRVNEIGDFSPVFIDSTPRSFAAKVQRKLKEDEELDIAKGSLETRKCRSKINLNNCPYEPLCSMYEIYGVKLLEA